MVWYEETRREPKEKNDHAPYRLITKHTSSSRIAQQEEQYTVTWYIPALLLNSESTSVVTAAYG